MVLIMLVLAWLIIRKMFPFSQKTIELKIEGDVKFNWRTMVVAGTFILTILLWVFGKKYLGINANTVAMLPIAVFAFTGVLTADDLKEIDCSRHLDGGWWLRPGSRHERNGVGGECGEEHSVRHVQSIRHHGGVRLGLLRLE